MHYKRLSPGLNKINPPVSIPLGQSCSSFVSHLSVHTHAHTPVRTPVHSNPIYLQQHRAKHHISYSQIMHFVV